MHPVARPSRIRRDPALVTKAPKIKKEFGLIDWSKTAQAVHNLVRAMQPWPVAFTFWHRPERDPLRVIVHRTAVVEGSGTPGSVLEAEGDRLVVAAREGAVRLVTVQIEGKKPMSVADFLRGHHVLPGDRMGPVALDSSGT